MEFVSDKQFYKYRLPWHWISQALSRWYLHATYKAKTKNAARLGTSIQGSNGVKIVTFSEILPLLPLKEKMWHYPKRIHLAIKIDDQSLQIILTKFYRLHLGLVWIFIGLSMILSNVYNNNFYYYAAPTQLYR